MSKKTLIIGASLKSDRYSNIVIMRLVANGHEVKAIGIKEGKVGGIKIETGLRDFIGIDTVSMYLNPIRQIGFYDYIISLKPKRVIFNPGTENTELIEFLKKNNIETEIACNLVLLAVNQY